MRVIRQAAATDGNRRKGRNIARSNTCSRKAKWKTRKDVYRPKKNNRNLHRSFCHSVRCGNIDGQFFPADCLMDTLTCFLPSQSKDHRQPELGVLIDLSTIPDSVLDRVGSSKPAYDRRRACGRTRIHRPRRIARSPSTPSLTDHAPASFECAMAATASSGRR
jgi:hypothetical protein